LIAAAAGIQSIILWFFGVASAIWILFPSKNLVMVTSLDEHFG